MSEIWKEVPTLHHRYEVSNLGRIRKPIHTNRYGCTYGGGILSQSIGHFGYYQICLSVKQANARTTFLVHRLVATAFVPNPDPVNKILVNHKNGNKLDNRAENLEWVTSTENQLHALETGLKVNKKGEEHPQATLSNAQVYEVRKLYIESDLDMGTIASQFNVSHAVVSLIINLKTWTNVGIPCSTLDEYKTRLAEKAKRIKSASMTVVSRSTRCKLTFKQAQEIRKRILNGEKQSHLAKEYGVTTTLVQNIHKNKTYLT